MPRALYICIWRKNDWEMRKHRELIREQKFLVDFNLDEDEFDEYGGKGALIEDDYEGLGNFSGNSDMKKPSARPKTLSTVQVMQTSHGIAH